MTVSPGRLIGAEHGSDATYLLLSGIVRVTTKNSRQERVLYDLLGPGDVIPYPSLLSALSLDLQCEAFTFCTLGRIQTELLIEQTVGALRKQNFRLAWELMMGRWWSMLARRAELLRLNLADRVVFTFIELARKFGHPDGPNLTLNLELTHARLAELVCASRPKVSQVLKTLERRGALHYVGRGRVVVLPEKLKLGRAPDAASAKSPEAAVAAPGRNSPKMAGSAKPRDAMR